MNLMKTKAQTLNGVASASQPKRGRLWAFCALWLAGFVWLLMPIRFPINPDHVTFDGTNILVTFQETTGPSFRVIGGQNALRIATVEAERLRPSQPILGLLNTEEVELIGEGPSDLTTYLYMIDSDWVLSGRVIGLSARWCEAFSGVVPLFWVESCRPTEYVTNLLIRTDYLSMAIYICVFLCLLLLVFRIWLGRKH